MTEVLTYSEYYSEIERIGEEARSVPERERVDWLHEMLDEHEYVIYTAKAAAVLRHSSNDEAAFEDGVRPFVSLSDVYVVCAFYAMLADVREWLDAHPDDEEEERLEEEEEEEEVPPLESKEGLGTHAVAALLRDLDQTVEETLKELVAKENEAAQCSTCGADHGCDEQGNRRDCDLDFEEEEEEEEE